MKTTALGHQLTPKIIHIQNLLPGSITLNDHFRLHLYAAHRFVVTHYPITIIGQKWGVIAIIIHPLTLLVPHNSTAQFGVHIELVLSIVGNFDNTIIFLESSLVTLIIGKLNDVSWRSWPPITKASLFRLLLPIFLRILQIIVIYFYVLIKFCLVFGVLTLIKGVIELHTYLTDPSTLICRWYIWSGPHLWRHPKFRLLFLKLHLQPSIILRVIHNQLLRLLQQNRIYLLPTSTAIIFILLCLLLLRMLNTSHTRRKLYLLILFDVFNCLNIRHW